MMAGTMAKYRIAHSDNLARAESYTTFRVEAGRGGREYSPIIGGRHFERHNPWPTALEQLACNSDEDAVRLKERRMLDGWRSYRR